MVLAVVRIRGQMNVRKEAAHALKMFRLNRPNHCVLVKPGKEVEGMLRQIQKYVTWGEVNKETLAKLMKKRGRLPGNKRLSEEYVKEKIGKSIEEFANMLIENNSDMKELPGAKPIFRLKPPRKGFKSAGIKSPFSLGGAYGYRGEKINELLRKMI